MMAGPFFSRSVRLLKLRGAIEGQRGGSQVHQGARRERFRSRAGRTLLSATAHQRTLSCQLARRRAGRGRSVECTMIEPFSSAKTTFTDPFSVERAPCLAALVANSCSSRAKLVTAEPETLPSIPEIAMHGCSGSSAPPEWAVREHSSERSTAKRAQTVMGPRPQRRRLDYSAGARRARGGV
jgi:hypothetical protein